MDSSLLQSRLWNSNWLGGSVPRSPKTTLQALRSGAVSHRIAPLYERRKLHKLVDQCYNRAAAHGSQVVGYALVVLVRHPDFGGEVRPFTRSATRDNASLVAALRTVEQAHLDHYAASLYATDTPDDLQDPDPDYFDDDAS